MNILVRCGVVCIVSVIVMLTSIGKTEKPVMHIAPDTAQSISPANVSLISDKTTLPD